MKSYNRTALEHALAAAYHGKQIAEPDEYWEIRVMNHIRSLGPLNTELADMMRFVWRFAAAVSFPLLILIIYMIQTGFHPEYELAELLLDNSSELTFLSYFGNLII